VSLPEGVDYGDCGESHEEENHGKDRQPETDPEVTPYGIGSRTAEAKASSEIESPDFLAQPKPHDFVLAQICEYHFSRKGTLVPAAHDMNGDYMCEPCFSGRHVLHDELEGDRGASILSRAQARYFQKHKAAIYEKRRRARLARTTG